MLHFWVVFNILDIKHFATILACTDKIKQKLFEWFSSLELKKLKTVIFPHSQDFSFNFFVIPIYTGENWVLGIYSF